MVYLVIICYLFYVHRKISTKLKSTREKSILVFACTRFLCDLFLALSCTYFPYSPTAICQLYLALGQPINNLCLPPLLYLLLQRYALAE
uniref:G_PROTEIN_RECEP_F1_2 domain-containing protein n=1 Tax=Steinernema glaseri TaxID=37863 RepID=A0A1I7YN44_9BILA